MVRTSDDLVTRHPVTRPSQASFFPHLASMCAMTLGFQSEKPVPQLRVWSERNSRESSCYIHSTHPTLASRDHDAEDVDRAERRSLRLCASRSLVHIRTRLSIVLHVSHRQFGCCQDCRWCWVVVGCRLQAVRALTKGDEPNIVAADPCQELAEETKLPSKPA